MSCALIRQKSVHRDESRGEIGTVNMIQTALELKLSERVYS